MHVIVWRNVWNIGGEYRTGEAEMVETGTEAELVTSSHVG